MAKILIIDDAKFMRSVIKKIVHELGHETVEAVKGQDGLREISIENPVEIFADLSGKEFASALINFCGIISASSVLTLSLKNASRLVVTLTDEEPESDGFEEVMADTLYEVGNIIISGILAYKANKLDTHLEHSVPEYIKGEIPGLLRQSGPNKKMDFLPIRTTFKVQTPQIDGLIFIALEQGSLESLITVIE